MAFQQIHFQGPQESNESIFENAARQYQGLNAPHMLDQEMQQTALKNAQMQSVNFMKELQAKQYEEELLADLKLKHAQALHHNQQAKGENQYAPTEPFKLRKDYNDAVKKYGKDSEEAQYYKQAMENHIYSHGEGRFAPTATTKYENERKAAIEKHGPNSQEVKNLELAQNKERSDEATRNSALAATNLQKTMTTMNIDDLVRYSGPAGQIQLGIEKAKALAGQASPEYLRYEQAVTSIKTEADELAKFLKTPAHKKAYNDIHELTNPTGWGTSPQIAKAKLERLRDIVNKTATTFQEAQTSTEQHLGTKGKEEAIKKVETSQPSQKYKAHTKEDILETARQSGKTVAEIEELIRKAEEGK